jgi:hypothetical protein
MPSVLKQMKLSSNNFKWYLQAWHDDYFALRGLLIFLDKKNNYYYKFKNDKDLIWIAMSYH